MSNLEFLIYYIGGFIFTALAVLIIGFLMKKEDEWMEKKGWIDYTKL